MPKAQLTKNSLPKTNASRFLDQQKIAYEMRAYEVDLNDLSAQAVAQKVGMDVERVWKTLLVQAGPSQFAFAVVAGNDELDRKALASLAGFKTCDLVPLAQVEPLTGYVRGGVTVFAAKKSFPVFVDQKMQLHSQVSVSAGQRGLQIWIDPADYIRASSAKVGRIARDSNATEAPNEGHTESSSGLDE